MLALIVSIYTIILVVFIIINAIENKKARIKQARLKEEQGSDYDDDDWGLKW